MALNEFGLIEKYFTGLGPAANPLVALGVGDDCALLDPPPGQQLALSIDTLVADVHFPAAADPYLIAQRALRVTLSDLAATGATPLAFTLALTLPAADENWLAAFSRGLRAAADAFNITLIGGDTTRGPQSVITIQVMGLVTVGQALLRSGAKAGDAVLVSGTLGDARAALDYLALPAAQLDAQPLYFLQRYYTPAPRLALGTALRGVASAAIDISDGLAADLGHILERSDVGASLDLTKLPLSTALQSRPEALEFALSGGDDYELCFTVPPARLDRAFALARQLDIPIAAIGIITQAKEFTGYGRGGEVIALQKSGYQHF